MPSPVSPGSNGPRHPTPGASRHQNKMSNTLTHGCAESSVPWLERPSTPHARCPAAPKPIVKHSYTRLCRVWCPLARRALDVPRLEPHGAEIKCQTLLHMAVPSPVSAKKRLIRVRGQAAPPSPQCQCWKGAKSTRRSHGEKVSVFFRRPVHPSAKLSSGTLKSGARGPCGFACAPMSVFSQTPVLDSCIQG